MNKEKKKHSIIAIKTYNRTLKEFKENYIDESNRLSISIDQIDEYLEKKAKEHEKNSKFDEYITAIGIASYAVMGICALCSLSVSNNDEIYQLELLAYFGLTVGTGLLGFQTINHFIEKYLAHQSKSALQYSRSLHK